jgi:hypothetical protein
LTLVSTVAYIWFKLITRDKIATSRVIDALVPTLYDDTTGVVRRFKRSDGRVRLVNQDVEWSLVGLRDSVLIRNGSDADVVWNSVVVKDLDWRRKVFSSFSKRSGVGQDGIDRARGLSKLFLGVKSWTGKGGWLNNGWKFHQNTSILAETSNDSSSASSDFLSDATSSDIQTSQPNHCPTTDNCATAVISSITPENAASVPFSCDYPLIGPDEADPATSNTVVLDKVNFDFLKLYLIVGWVSPTMMCSQPTELSSVTVQSLTLAGTSDYVYLASERFDVWPPPFFPPELHPTDAVNSSIILDASSALDQLQSLSNTSSSTKLSSSTLNASENIMLSKGITADVVC